MTLFDPNEALVEAQAAPIPVRPWRRGLIGQGMSFAQREGSVLAMTTVGTNIVRIGSTLALTRLLTPQVFGLVGIITSLFFMMGMLTDFGVQSFVTRDKRAEDDHYMDVVWTIHAIRGVVISTVAIALAKPIELLIDKPGFALPFAVASITFTISGLSSMSVIAALRRGFVRRLCWFELGIYALQVVASIAAAAVLRNAWAIILAMLLKESVRSILSYFIFPRARQNPSWDREIAFDFWRFSRVAMMSSMITLLLAQSDKLVFARLFSLPEFGLYVIATNIANAPTVFASSYSSRVLLPRYAVVWHDDPAALPTAYYRQRRNLAMAYAFGAGLLVGAAHLIIRVLYDPRYAEAGLYLTLLSLSSLVGVSSWAAKQALIAVGEVRETLRTNLVRLGWLVVMGTTGYRLHGALGLVAAVGTMEFAGLAYNWWALRRHGILNLRLEAREIGVGLVGVALGLGLNAAATLALAWL